MGVDGRPATTFADEVYTTFGEEGNLRSKISVEPGALDNLPALTRLWVGPIGHQEGLFKALAGRKLQDVELGIDLSDSNDAVSKELLSGLEDTVWLSIYLRDSSRLPTDLLSGFKDNLVLEFYDLDKKGGFPRIVSKISDHFQCNDQYAPNGYLCSNRNSR